jgi:hypothetical protein
MGLNVAVLHVNDSYFASGLFNLMLQHKAAFKTKQQVKKIMK